ncbi:protein STRICTOSIDINE SYNTHASE-LIKE 10-like [Aristolochia californica]|uniref:protein STRICTOSIDINE SYNTHASE-LIKE 10-like n=1 Tax=Aristolochia californica TaxID=171875 RepID=UPI0035E0986F
MAASKFGLVPLLLLLVISFSKIPLPACSRPAPGPWPSQRYSRIDLPPGVTGPETAAFDTAGGGPYTGVSDGRILKFVPKNGWVDFATTTQNRTKQVCDRNHDPQLEATCGRPLGLRFNSATGRLFIADAYHGLLEVGPGGGLATQVAGEAEGEHFRFTNGLDIDQQNGIVYFTDSSTQYQRWYLIAVTSDKTGRLLSYNPRTRAVRVLLRGLAFANGVALSGDNSFLLVAETSLFRVVRYWLSGPRAGTHEVFVNVPGSPDNLKRNSRGEFWITTSWGWEQKSAMPSPPSTFESSPTGHIVAMKFSEDARLLGVIGDNDLGGMVEVSEVEERNNMLWIGSVVVPYVGLVRP